MSSSGTLTVGNYSAVQQSGPSSSAFFVVSFTPQVVNVLAADSLQVDSLVFIDGTVALDPAGVLEVGNAGTASAGTVTVDPGASILISNGFTPVIGPGLHQGATFTTEPMRTLIASGVLNNGTISGAIALGNVINTGTITDGTTVGLNSNTGIILSSVVTGGTNLGTIIGGTISSLVNDGVILGGTVSGISGAGTLAVDPSADDDTLTIGTGVSNPVTFDDNAGMLVVQVDSASPANTPLIEGFTQGDQIFLSGVTAAAASYLATSPGLGTLTIASNDTAIASFALAGSYDGATFLATPLFDALPPGTGIVLATGTAGAGTNPPSLGTAGNDYLWTATTGGDWGDAANWQDLTTGGTSAAVAPGSADSVTITSTIAGNPYNASLFQIISGQGNAATLTTVGDVALGGIFQAGSITIGDASTLDVVSGSTLSVGSLSFHSGGLLEAMGGSLNITSPIDGSPGALFAGNHATVHLAEGLTSLGFVGFDATAVIEVGTAGTASPGTLTIDPNATFGLTTIPGTIVVAPNVIVPFMNVDGPVLNNGTVTGGTYGSIINNGTIENAVLNSGVNNNLIIDGVVSNLTGSGALEVSGLNPVLTIGAGVSNDVDFVSTHGTIIFTTASATPATTGYGTGDVLIDQAATAADTGIWTPGTGGAGTLILSQGATSLATLSLVGDYSSSTFFVTNGTVSLTPPPVVTCFGPGTRIRTPHGDVAVETLQPGDEVVTFLQPSPQRVRWVGYRTIDLTRDPRPADNLPVRVRAGAFADDLPHRDLLLSPAHAVYVEGVLIPVKRLINGTTVSQIKVASITYWHVELDRHDVLLAEGLPAESYLDTGDRAAFANGGAVVTMRPDFQALIWEAEGCARLVVTGPELDRARALLRGRAQGATAERPGRRRAAA